jgi:hypothetical protein
MKKRYGIVVLAFCLGIFFTWGVLSVSASQSPPDDPLTPLANSTSAILTVYVKNASGQPAVNAMVNAYTINGVTAGGGSTGVDGSIDLNLPPGTYTIRTSSMYDNFYLTRSNISAPGTVNITTNGASRVTLTAKTILDAPLAHSYVQLSVTGDEVLTALLSYTDPNGILVFYVTPGFYNVGMVNASNRYCLYKMSQELTNPTSSVDFDMSHQSYANLIVHHPFDERSSLALYLADANLGEFHITTWDGDNVVLTPGLGYYLSQEFFRDDTEGNNWGYYFTLGQNIYLDPSEVLTFSAGGTISATGRTADAYVGEAISLTRVVDNFDNPLQYIFKFVPGQFLGTRIYPQITLTDPDGHSITMQSPEYTIPLTATLGTYDVHMEWDTGPYQDLLVTDSQFKVLPQQTSAVVSPEGGTLYSPWDDTLYEFAPGTFSDDVLITHTVRYTEIPFYPPLVGIGHFFDVTAVYSDTGLPAQPTQPYTITIGYTDSQRGVVIEDSMGLYNWDGVGWMLEPTGLVDPVNNHLVATPDHFSTWGVLGETNRVFMALINKK